MSIFKSTFIPVIRKQIENRQYAMTTRTSKNLQYLNSRNAWARMSSGVNVNGTNALAKKYILQGGILNSQGQLRSGLGGVDGAYSNISPSGNAYGYITSLDFEGGTTSRLAEAGTAGIRPMPGITNISISSKGAYGSLREAIVNFKAWSIQQLEDLELLYMRPGYTILLEWGWSPHLTNDNVPELETNIDYYDIVNEAKPKEKIWKEIFAKSTDGIFINDEGKQEKITGKNYPGNYDAMLGFVKNYSWSARPDGGYDCQTTIITLGEVIESLKVNYTPSNAPSIIANGLIASKLGINVDSLKVSGSYSQNVLAGLFTELYEIGIQKTGGSEEDINKGISFSFKDPTYPTYTYDLFRKTINLRSSAGDITGGANIAKSDEQVYIRLESLVDILNNYVLLQDIKAKKPFAELSVKEREYDAPRTTSQPQTPSTSTPPQIPFRSSTSQSPLVFNPTASFTQTPPQTFKNKISGNGYLKALAHPLTLSIDPTVCVIKNKLWTDVLDIKIDEPSVSTDGTPVVIYDPTKDYTKIVEEIRNRILTPSPSFTPQSPSPGGVNVPSPISTQTTSLGGVNLIELREYSKVNGLQGNTDGLKELNQQFIRKYKVTVGNFIIQTIQDPYRTGLASQAIRAISVPEGEVDQQKINTYFNALITDPAVSDAQVLTEQKEKISQSVSKAKENLVFLNELDFPYFVNDNYNTELGIIGNIYVNLSMLYNMSLDSGLASLDRKEKNEIALYDFIKAMMKRISTAIGEVNNFDLHVDPSDNKTRIIDVNYVDFKENNRTAYDNAFELQLHNLKSTVRSYTLQSQIFPEQSTIIAIGAQYKGGALGTDTSTLVDFNKNITDRIVPEKNSPIAPTTGSSPVKLISDLSDSLGTLYTFFSDLDYDNDQDADFNIDNVSKYQNSLRDIINFFREIGNSETKNKAIIPTKLSVEMDGIGGLVIGHIFRIPNDLLPKGYKGNVDGGEGSVGSKLGYIVTGIGHNIQNNDWVTKLDAQTIILDEPSGVDIKWESLILKTIRSKEGPAIEVNNKNTAKGSVSESSTKYPVLVKKEEWKKQYNAEVQKYAKVSEATPVADQLRADFKKYKGFIIEKGSELSSNGDITPQLRSAVLSFADKLVTTTGFEFISAKTPIVITAGNDAFHRTYGEKRNRTTHSRGLAIDIRTSTFTRSQVDSIMNLLKQSGFGFTLYHGPIYHIHANISTE